MHEARMTRRIGRLIASLIALSLALACGPVFIPVPPPSQTTFTLEVLTDQQGNQSDAWIAAGGPEPRASNGTYYIFNQQRNAGVIAGAAADGSYQAPPMGGAAGDHVLINYKDAHGKFSPSACLLLGEARPTALLCPP